MATRATRSAPASSARLDAPKNVRNGKNKRITVQTKHSSPAASMKAQPENARSRYLSTISTMEKVPVTDLEAAAGEQTKWLWLLNAGDMAARARSGITLPENLPGTPVQIVELLAKPYALIEYKTSDDAKVAFEAESKAVFALAAPSVVQSIMAKLPLNHPTPTLLSADPPTYEFSNGLILMHEFITEEEEKEMIREYHIATASRDGRVLKRGAVHYGPHFDYTTFAVSKSASTPPPEYLRRLLSRLPARDDRDIPDQYTLQHYPPGTGIPPHVDTHSAFEETIYSLSFGASTRMDFKLCGEKESRRLRLPKRSLGGGNETPPPPPSPPVEVVEEKTEEWELKLPARSLLLMRGPSRYGYTHGIKGRKHDQDGPRLVARQDRYSLTMRKIKPAERIGCNCEYGHVCS